jgi:amino acid adenylation domain-containing protein
MLVHRFLEDAAHRRPDAAAVIEETGTTTYAALDRRANQFSHLIRSAGASRGDRVVIALDNGVELIAAHMGAMKAGCVSVLLPSGPRSDRLRHAVDDCKPLVAIVDAGAAGEIDGGSGSRPITYVAGQAQDATAGARPLQMVDDCPDHSVSVRSIDLDLAAVIYTSGSTGAPRGVMLTHRNFVANARSIVQYLQLTHDDRVMCVLPFHYVYGLSLLHTHLAVGGSLVVENRSVFPNVVLQSMQEHRVTGFAGVPSTFALMLHRSALQETALPHLRYVTQAGGAMPPARITEWLQRGPRVPFYVMYGATEAAARLTYLPPSDLGRKLGSIGRPIPNVEIQVITESGAPAKPGEVGELVARGSNISCGYWGNQEETAARFRAGTYRTGDVGYRDDEGYLFLVGRQHDLIKVGAHRVGSKEIEDVLHEHPAILEAAVLGEPHDLLGESPVAFVALRDQLIDAATVLRRFCATRLPTHKVPSRIVVRAELPKLTATGKIDRVALRKTLQQEP